MIVRGATREELGKALELVNVKYQGNVSWNRRPEKVGKGFRLTLRVKDSKGPGHRLGYTSGSLYFAKTHDEEVKFSRRRRLVSACWHIHGDFFEALPPDAKIITGRGVVRPGQWPDYDIGSMLNPQMISEACECKE